MSFRNGGYARGNNYYSRTNNRPPSQAQRIRYSNSSINNVGSAQNYSFGQKNSQLYMGDLDPNWDENTINQIWSSLGESNVEIRMMWNNNTNAINSNVKRSNLGYCFVDFPSSSHASNALLKNGTSVPGFPSKILKLNWASSSAPGPAPGQSYQELSVFVGDLAPNVTEAQLFELFISRYPSTAHAKVVHDQVTGISKGYAFVKFNNPEDQQRALQEMQGIYLNGRAIRVSNAGHNYQQNANNRIDGRRFNAANNVKKFDASARQGLHTSQFMYPVQQEPPLNSFTDPNNTTVFIGGLSASITENHLRLYFQPFGQIVYVKIPVGRGCGFVQYVDRISAELAILKMQGFLIGDSRIRTSWGRPAKQAAIIKVVSGNEVQPRNPQFSQSQHHPSLKQPTYAYTPVAPFYQSHAQQLSSDTCGYADHNNTSLLLPNSAFLKFSCFPQNSSGLHSPYESIIHPEHEKQKMGYTGQESNLVPQIFADDDIAFVNGREKSLYRLEDGSNGFIFA